MAIKDFFSNIFKPKKPDEKKPTTPTKPSSSGGGGTKPTTTSSFKNPLFPGKGGTYYAGSGTYIDSSGSGMSVEKPPAGAKIVFGKDPYVSGGTKPTTPTKPSSSGGGRGSSSGGTYYARSGTYIPPAGSNQGYMSVATPPAGATISLNKDPFLSGGRPFIPTAITPKPTVSPAQVTEIARQHQIDLDTQRIKADIEKRKSTEEIMRRGGFSTLNKKTIPSELELSNIQQKQLEKLQEQKKSVATNVTEADIDKLLKEEKISAETALTAHSAVKTAEIQKVYEQDFKEFQKNALTNAQENYKKSSDTLWNSYKERVDELGKMVQSGQIDYKTAQREADQVYKNVSEKDKLLLDEVNKDLENKTKNWNEDWQKTKGVELGTSATKSLALKDVEYRKEQAKLKNQAKTFLKSAKSGAIVGGATTAGLKILGAVAPKVAVGAGSILSGVGTVATAGVVGYSAYNLYDNHQKDKEYYTKIGFTEKEAIKLANKNLEINAKNMVAEAGGFVTGAYSASKVVGAITNINKLSKVEQARVESAFAKNKNALYLKQDYRKISEHEIKVLKKNIPDAKVNILQDGKELTTAVKTLRGGEIVKSSSLAVDTARLNQQEIKALNKLLRKTKVRELSYTQYLGPRTEQYSLSLLKTPVKEGIGISRLSGTTKDGIFKGGRVKAIYEKPRGLGRTFSLTERSVSQVAGKGNVKYGQDIFSPEPLFKARYEVGVGKEKVIRKDIFEKGFWTRSEINAPTTITRGAYASKGEGVSLGLFGSPKGKVSFLQRIFSDVRVAESSGEIKTPPKIKVSKIKPPSLFDTQGGLISGASVSGVKGGGKTSLFNLKQKVETTEIPTESIFNIKTEATQVAKGIGKDTQMPSLFPVLPSQPEKVSLVEGKITSRFSKPSQVFGGSAKERLSLISPEKKKSKEKSARVSLFGLGTLTEQTQAQPQQIKPSQIQPQQTKQIQQQIQIQKLGLSQLTIPKQIFTSGLFKPTPTPTSFGIPFGFGQRPSFGKEKEVRKPEGTSLFGKTEYTPSLGLVLLKAKPKKVTKEEYEKLSKEKYTGLEARHLVAFK